MAGFACASGTFDSDFASNLPEGRRLSLNRGSKHARKSGNMSTAISFLGAANLLSHPSTSIHSIRTGSLPFSRPVVSQHGIGLIGAAYGVGPCSRSRAPPPPTPSKAVLSHGMAPSSFESSTGCSECSASSTSKRSSEPRRTKEH